jgi:hypothetical protein
MFRLINVWLMFRLIDVWLMFRLSSTLSILAVCFAQLEGNRLHVGLLLLFKEVTSLLITFGLLHCYNR